MPANKIVARYNDGRVLKGFTTSFSPNAPHFFLTPAEDGPAAKPVTVEMARLKAVFFVRDFAGNPGRRDRQHFVSNQAYQGCEIQVEFNDGEVMVGSTPGYGPEMPGFFIFPADTDSNTLKVFAVASSVRKVELLTANRRGGADRRSGEDRRKAQLPFEGPDRRKGGDRRSGVDRRGLLR